MNNEGRRRGRRRKKRDNTHLLLQVLHHRLTRVLHLGHQAREAIHLGIFFAQQVVPFLQLALQALDLLPCVALLAPQQLRVLGEELHIAGAQ